MSRSLSASERRTVTIGLIIALPVLLFLAARPLRTALADSREQLAIETETLAREQAAIAAARRSPELQHVADSLMQRVSPRLFSGRDDVMASAELVSYLDELAGSHHVLLSEDATRPAGKAKSAVRTLNVDIRGETDLQGLLEFLQAIEHGPKLLNVSRLDISRPTRDADDVETMQFAATVTGYALAAEPVALPKTKSAQTARDDSTVALKPGRGQ